jgi:vitamin B12 transporter
MGCRLSDRSSYLRIAAWAGCAGIAPAALGASPAPSAQVVVTATRTPSAIEEVLPSTIVVDRAELDRSVAADAADVLRFRAGLDIARNGGPGQTTSLFIRGAESNHTLVMVDGVRINPGTIGAPALQNLSPSLIERIEVVKGPRSALYGTDAIGGVVNIITRRGAQRGWTAEVGYGDYQTRDANLAGGWSGNAGELDLGVSWIDSEGFPTRTGDDVDRGFDNLSVSLQGRTSWRGVDIGVRHWSAQGNTEYSDFFLTPVDQDFTNSTTALDAAWTLGERSRLRATASYMEDRIEQQQAPDYLETGRFAFDLQHDWALNEHHALTSGVLLTNEEASSLSFGDSIDESTRVLNLFAQDSLEYGRHRATLGVGLTDHETFGSEFTWNADYGLGLGDGADLVLSAGTGFRAPDATDLYGYGGNPDLEPEESRSVSVELRQRFGSRHLVRAAAFQTDIDDLIEFVTLSFDPFVGENRNVERARIRGIEAGYEYQSEQWLLRADVVLQEPENRSTGEPLLRRPEHSATLAAWRDFGRFDFGVDVLAAGERKDFGFPSPVELDSYVLLNFSAGLDLGANFSLRARLENALDEQYELARGFNTPDRGFYLTLRYAPARDASAPKFADVRRERTWATD